MKGLLDLQNFWRIESFGDKNEGTKTEKCIQLYYGDQVASMAAGFGAGKA